jgi:hypothetical protein
MKVLPPPPLCAKPNGRSRNSSAGNTSANNWWHQPKDLCPSPGGGGRGRLDIPGKKGCRDPSGDYTGNKPSAHSHLCPTTQDRGHGFASRGIGPVREPASGRDHSLNCFARVRPSQLGTTATPLCVRPYGTLCGVTFQTRVDGGGQGGVSAPLLPVRALPSWSVSGWMSSSTSRTRNCLPACAACWLRSAEATREAKLGCAFTWVQLLFMRPVVVWHSAFKFMRVNS